MAISGKPRSFLKYVLPKTGGEASNAPRSLVRAPQVARSPRAVPQNTFEPSANPRRRGARSGSSFERSSVTKRLPEEGGRISVTKRLPEEGGRISVTKRLPEEGGTISVTKRLPEEGGRI